MKIILCPSCVFMCSSALIYVFLFKLWIISNYSHGLLEPPQSSLCWHHIPSLTHLTSRDLYLYNKGSDSFFDVPLLIIFKPYLFLLTFRPRLSKLIKTWGNFSFSVSEKEVQATAQLWQSSPLSDLHKPLTPKPASFAVSFLSIVAPALYSTHKPSLCE